MIRFVSRQPIGQSPLQPQPARLERVQPDGLERGQQSIRIVLPGPAQDKRHADHGLRLQRTNGGLAVVAEKFDQFVDDFGFVFLAGPGVTRTLQNQHFLSGNLTHFQVHSSVTPFLRQCMVHVNHFPPPTVTFFLSQFAGWRGCFFVLSSKSVDRYDVLHMTRASLLAALLVSSHSIVFGDALPRPDLIVAADGSGDFKTIQAAVASIPKTNTERIVVFVKDGTYHEKIRVDASFVTLRGQSRSGTRIEFPQLDEDFNKTPDATGRAVINLNQADDFVLEDLTAENTAGVIGPHAFTILGTGDRAVVVNCDVLSHGADTVSFWRGDRGRCYQANCRLEGSVDFVCPRGWCYVTNCTFYEMKNTAAVWHDGSKDKNMKFVLRGCRFDGTNGWNLARHHHDAQFYFFDCKFSKTMIDQPPFRVIYPLDGGTPSASDIQRNKDLDKSILWGERSYFYNCHRERGDYGWFTNNLS